MKLIAASAIVTATVVGLCLLTVVIDAWLPVKGLSDLLAVGKPGGPGGSPDTADDGDSLHQGLEALEPWAVIRQRRQLASAAEQVMSQLVAERTTVADLTSTLASTERAATARIATLQDQLEQERARSAIALQDLARAREQIARTFRDRLVGVERQVSADDELVTDRIRHAADPAAGSDMPPMAVRSGGGSAAVEGPGDGDAPPIPPASELQHGASLEGDAASRSMSAVGGIPEVALPEVALPEGVEARVTLRYAHGSESARRRAVELGRALQARGIDAAEPVDGPAAIANGQVTYFYETDRASAEHVAALSIVSPLVRGRLPANGRIPRPGTIEIAVAD